MPNGSWAHVADRILAGLFIPGEPAPSAAELRDAYPFGERRYHPYKVWLARVSAWRQAHERGRAAVVSRRHRPTVARSGDEQSTFFDEDSARVKG